MVPKSLLFRESWSKMDDARPRGGQRIKTAIPELVRALRQKARHQCRNGPAVILHAYFSPFFLITMNIKTKIALHSVMQKVFRGVIADDQAAAEFKKMTGQELEEVVDLSDEETGKFMAFLETAYPEPQAAPPTEQEQDEPETDPSEQSSDAPAVPVDQPKRTRQNKPKEAN